MVGAKRILVESIPILALTTVGGVVAGLFLSEIMDNLALVPGLIILLPAVLGNRGNISGALGSRLASGLHLGLIKPELRWNKTLQDNLLAAVLLNVVMSVFLGVVAYYAYTFVTFTDGSPASITDLTLISFLAGTSAGIILTALAAFIAIITYSHGLDPDNVLAPSLATVGDIITVLCLLGAVRFVI